MHIFIDLKRKFYEIISPLVSIDNMPHALCVCIHLFETQSVILSENILM